MATLDSLPRRRRPPQELAARQQAVAIIRPFLPRFEDWNHRAARASASILSHVTTEPEKKRHRDDLAQLRGEVEAAYDEFQSAVAGQPPHSRIDDVDAAFERLLSVLRRTAD